MLAAFLPAVVHAQVVEPNGARVPSATPGAGELSLQAFFDAQGEDIDAQADASIEPQVFSPRCDFAAALVLSESQAQAGIGWYNVPEDPEAAPEKVYEIVPPGAEVGEVISSADVRSHPAYAGGLIGFVLLKQGNRVYYSEHQRNAFCSECAEPGHWKMTLVYNSSLERDSFYLAFEDWEGANESTWFGNDGDFNDKVFRVSGVTCLGGGEPCDTGRPGACGPGLTECAAEGGLVCAPQRAPQSETCDNVDNDCDGEVDDGEGLCPAGEICSQGQCVEPCNDTEFPCDGGFTCVDGLCIEIACAEVRCEPGRVCRGGTCGGGCDGVVCPLGQDCQLGRCVDACRGVACGPATVCEHGACVARCGCRGCASGELCTPQGRCVQAACAAVRCESGFACVDGACVDACRDARCPGGEVCSRGLCGESGVPEPPEDSGRDGGSGATSREGSGPDAGGGCGCDLAPGRAPRGATVLCSLLLLAVAMRRRLAGTCWKSPANRGRGGR